MNTTLLLLIAAGSLVLMIGLIFVLVVARSLEGAPANDDPKPSGKIEKAVAALQAASRSASKWGPGPLGAALSALASQSDEGEKTPTDERKAVKQIVTGMAVFAGLIALIMGIIAGDG